MKSTQQGFGLIEVLVALLILAISILGFSIMQLQSVRATSEAVDRTQVLTIMRSFAERIRANSSALDTYVTDFHAVKANTYTEPNNLCVTTDINAANCSAADLANADVWQFKRQLDTLGLSMDIQACPSSGGETSTNVMYSYCLIASWGITTPTIGTDDDPSDGSMDCLTGKVVDSNNAVTSTGGTYHRKATCLFMEIN